MFSLNRFSGIALLWPADMLPPALLHSKTGDEMLHFLVIIGKII